ncbi:MAG: cell division/cell wall cluster transcriptional repressor MraZ [Fimbriimonas ginsengisoli]|uniref:Transcriptional regulator MraZ n=1 Tax=Fimbriimonas ginsengisoli TaxID=1005039 RepID=A0A931LTW1_FIMGI|nr:cell division/cell wall cluster transcriptional repressor MraZ [Fimbriimonas ginsengisoli]MBI3721376.1 cell division/cell wall cluster transcriptional repressor MraZ [Fimbriimonas ginsengisoli]
MEVASDGTVPKPLTGTDEAVLDSKGRLLLSKKKRDRLGDSFAIGIGAIGCLVAYPREIWQRMLAEIDRFPTINSGRQSYTRLMLGQAEDELECDAQGRVVIPQKLRQASKLEQDVVLVGCGDRLEIWAKEEWRKFNEFPDYGKDRLKAIERAHEQMLAWEKPR